jgi:ABC-2 type transport system permease protein
MSVFLRAFKDNRFTLLIWIAVGAIFGTMDVIIFPRFKGSGAADQIMEMIPTFVRGMIGTRVQPLSTLNGFLTMHFFSWCPLMGTFFGIALCSSALSAEMESRSIEVLLSRPVSRGHIVVAKYLAYCLCATIFSASVLLTLFSAIGHKDLAEDADLFGYACAVFQMTFVYFAIGAISLFISSLVEEQKKAMGISSGVILGMLLINAISHMNDTVNALAIFSIFHYFQAGSIMNLGHPEWMDVLHLTTFSVVFLFAAAYTFDRRDMPS